MEVDPLFDRHAELVLHVVEQHGAGQLLFAAVVCNRCGEVAVADDLEQLRPLVVGWKLAPEPGGDDYCPRCRP